MKIRSKLLIGYVLLAVLTAVVGYFGTHIVTSVDDEFRRQTEDEMPLNQALQELKYAGLRIVSSTTEYGFLLSNTESAKVAEELAEEQELIANGIRTYHQSLHQYETLIGKTRRDGVLEQDLDALRASGEELLRSSAALVTAMEKGQKNELLELKERNEAAEQKFLHLADQQNQAQNAYFDSFKVSTHETMDDAVRTIWVIAAGTFVLALLCGLIIAESISRRLGRLQQAAQKMGAGELDTVVVDAAADEIGALATAFRNMAGALARSTGEIVAGKDYLNEVINSMMDALIVVSADGTVLSINGEACSMLGYDEEPVGKSFIDILPDFCMEELALQGYIRDEEKTFFAKDGRTIPVAFSGSVLWNADSTVRGVVCVARDITRRKQTEAELKRYNEELLASNEELRSTEERLERFTRSLQDINEELKNFAYIISHDLRAPLVNIKGFTGELKTALQELAVIQKKHGFQVEGNDGAKVTEILHTDVPEALEFINSSVTRMDTLINLVLKLSRLGHRELRPEPVDLSELVDGVLKTLTHQLEQKNTQVIIGTLPEVTQDRAALEQIMGNLLDNAVKYLDVQRQGRLEIWAEEKAGEYIVHCRDNGRGISLDDLNKVFEIFRRAGKQDVQGEGMGLAYVKALVRRLGGQIWCDSQFGVGSTFSFSLPGAASEPRHRSGVTIAVKEQP